MEHVRIYLHVNSAFAYYDLKWYTLLRCKTNRGDTWWQSAVILEDPLWGIIACSTSGLARIGTNKFPENRGNNRYHPINLNASVIYISPNYNISNLSGSFIPTQLHYKKVQVYWVPSSVPTYNYSPCPMSLLLRVMYPADSPEATCAWMRMLPLTVTNIRPMLGIIFFFIR